MTQMIPFAGIEFADNPEPRCACVLLIDTSASMAGQNISELNSGLRHFATELKQDQMASKRVEIAIVGFGPVQTIQYFVTADSFEPPTLSATGSTPMGEAIMHAIALLDNRKADYKSNGVGYYRPWIFLITDGAPTDDIQVAKSAIQMGEALKSFMFYPVGVEGADLLRLTELSCRQPLKLRGLSFRELFVWLSNSLSSVSRSQVGEAVPLSNPQGPQGWAIVD